jgi:hypothetical protein
MQKGKSVGSKFHRLKEPEVSCQRSEGIYALKMTKDLGDASVSN